MGVNEGIFLVGWGAWNFCMGKWGWVGVGGGISAWVVADGWFYGYVLGWVDIFYGWVGVSEGIFCVAGIWWV